MKRFVCALIVGGCLMLGACHSHRLPAGVMTEEQMVGFLLEAYLIEGFYAVETNFKYDTLASQAKADYEALLSRRGLTAEQVEASFAYYAKHTDRYLGIQQKVVDSLNRSLNF